MREIMTPLYRMDPTATPKEVARIIMSLGITRLGVFENGEFLGWVTLTDLSRYFSRKVLLEAIRSHNEPERSEFLCPMTRSAFMPRYLSAHEGRDTGV